MSNTKIDKLISFVSNYKSFNRGHYRVVRRELKSLETAELNKLSEWLESKIEYESCVWAEWCETTEERNQHSKECKYLYMIDNLLAERYYA